MATTTSPSTSTKPSFARRWFPAIVFALGAIGVAVVLYWPDERWAGGDRTVVFVIATGLPIVLSLAWLLMSAPYPFLTRLKTLVILLIPVAGFIASVDWGRMRFDGNLVPTNIPWRWQGSYRGHDTSASRPIPEESLLPTPHDWTEYRGPRRDGIVTGPELARDWTEKTPVPLWRQPVGEGLSSFAVQGGIAVTLEQLDDNEAIVCYELETGKPFWTHSYPALFSEPLGGPGPRSTPTIHEGDVFALGATGILTCLDARTGAEKWSKNILENNANLKWAMAGSPLVYKNLVIVNPGMQSSAAAGVLAAYDRATGEHKWSSSGERASAGYSSPMLATLSGKQQILLLDGKGFSGYDPEDGKQLWRHPWETMEDINASQPLVLGDDRVFLSSGYNVGSAVLEIKENAGTWTVRQVWKNTKLRAKFSSPVLLDGHIYGLDEGILVCLDANTGERKWRGERYGHGQMLLTNGLLLILSEQGELALVEATPTESRELARFQALDGRTWNLPVLTGGKALVRNHLEMALYDLRAER